MGHRLLRIICVGNRYIYPDGAALWIYDEAIKQSWPSTFEWVEGGLGGLNLLPYFETNKTIIVIDFIPNSVNASLCRAEAVMRNFSGLYSHSNALHYLLSSLSTLLETVPKIYLMSCNPCESDWKDQIFQQIRIGVTSNV